MIVVLTTGCTIRHTLPAAAFQELRTGSPLRGVPPRVVVMHELRNDAAAHMKCGPHVYDYDQLPAAIVSGAIAREFRRNGHECVEGDAPSSRQADVHIEGVLYRFYLIETVRGRQAQVGVKLFFRSGVPNRPVFAKSYEPIFETGLTLCSESAMKDIMNEALLATVKEISMDQELVEYLRP